MCGAVDRAPPLPPGPDEPPEGDGRLPSTRSGAPGLVSPSSAVGISLAAHTTLVYAGRPGLQPGGLAADESGMSTKQIEAIATMKLLAAVTGAQVNGRKPPGMRAAHVAAFNAPTPPQGCIVCGDAEGVRCCEFGAAS